MRALFLVYQDEHQRSGRPARRSPYLMFINRYPNAESYAGGAISGLS